jgi:hypothetical protein
LWFPGKSRKFCISDNNGGSRKYEQLKEIIEISNRNKIDLKIFINPVHADLLEMMSFMGLWPSYESWKRNLAALTTEIAKQYPEKASIGIWDFSGYNSVTTEKIPVENDPQIQMKGYLEVAHYKKSVGDLILDKILESSFNQEMKINDFGYRLDIGDIEIHIERTRDNQRKYRDANKEYLEGMKIVWGRIKNTQKSVTCKIQ